MPFIITGYALAFCRAVIVIVFFVSSITKSRDISQFKRTISNFQLVPAKQSGSLAILFLSGEFVVFFLVLLGGPFLLAGFSLAVLLLVLFSLALLSVLTRGVSTSCNCFGASTKQVSFSDIWRNGSFILCAALGSTLLSLGKGQTELNLLEWLLMGLAAVIFVVIWLQIDDIVQLFRSF